MSKRVSRTQEEIEEALGRAYVFGRATKAELAVLAGHAEWVSLEDQATILTEGEACRYLYVLISGKLIVKEAVTPQMELIIARITPGDVVGDLGFVDRKAASATVRTDGAADLIRIEYLTLKEIFLDHPHLELVFYRELAKTLAERLRRGNLGLRRSLLTSSPSVFAR